MRRTTYAVIRLYESRDSFIYKDYSTSDFINMINSRLDDHDFVDEVEAIKITIEVYEDVYNMMNHAVIDQAKEENEKEKLHKLLIDLVEENKY